MAQAENYVLIIVHILKNNWGTIKGTISIVLIVFVHFSLDILHDVIKIVTYFSWIKKQVKCFKVVPFLKIHTKEEFNDVYLMNQF